MADLFDDAVVQIKAAYVLLGHSFGWRFLATPRRTLHANAEVALVTPNPGGSCIDPAHGDKSCEIGSAYVHERWKPDAPGKAPLQCQVRRMFDWLGRDPNETLSAYFVPFRSPSLKTLTRSRESFAFAVELWRRIFSEVRAPVVVCIGADVEKRLYAVLGKPDSTVTLPVGWGMRWLGSVATSSVSYCDYRTCRGFEYSAEQLPLSPCGSFVPSLPDTAPSLTFPFRGGTSD